MTNISANDQFVQIAAAASDAFFMLYGLTASGKIWRLTYAEEGKPVWVQLPLPDKDQV